MRALPIVALLLLASTVHALQVPQQRGNACAVVWDVGDATAVPGALRRQPWELVCADGDVRCDRDGAVNGQCEVRVAACVATSQTGCTPEALTALRIPKATRTALRGLVPPSLAATNTCGEAGTVVLEASGTRRRDVLLSLRSKTASGRGRNRLRVKCVPSSDCVDCPSACDVRACTRDAIGLPRSLTLTVGATGSDLDLGYKGDYHNQQLTGGTRLDMCLDGCDATTDALCDVTPVCDPTAGDVIGPPQPVFSNGVPTCLVTRRTGTSEAGTLDLASGAMTIPLDVEVDVYVQTTHDNVCPRCSGLQPGDRGKCAAGARNGLACTVDGTAFVFGSAGPSFDYNLSSDCLPEASKLASTVPLSLSLTTDDAVLDGPLPCTDQTIDDSCLAGTCTVDCSSTETAKGGLNQTCCSNFLDKPCFPTAPDSPPGSLVRTGTAGTLAPRWPDRLYPKTGTGTVLAAAFCLPGVNDTSVDLLAGLPGPGAAVVPVTVEVTAQE